MTILAREFFNSMIGRMLARETDEALKVALDALLGPQWQTSEMFDRIDIKPEGAARIVLVDEKPVLRICKPTVTHAFSEGAWTQKVTQRFERL